jgi:DNA-binding MarR family transcriptional regulator
MLIPSGRQLEVALTAADLMGKSKQFPSLSELADELKVNRSAVKKVLDALIEKGLLEGTFEHGKLNNLRFTAHGRKWLTAARRALP